MSCGRFGPNKIDEILLMQTINSAFQTSSGRNVLLKWRWFKDENVEFHSDAHMRDS
ncbi:Hypothetical predicted protein [Olea europaea subsp. europaea]|uniref:Uncharacterized protein n=1 Tax=Olea europaea subsp. europaea TaxID=158383 RepID=A0A8S0TFR9_OLEEU|nr:Hypothetical predicted protein [Olea europaea subsp. europaea]